MFGGVGGSFSWSFKWLCCYLCLLKSFSCATVLALGQCLLTRADYICKYHARHTVIFFISSHLSFAPFKIHRFMFWSRMGNQGNGADVLGMLAYFYYEKLPLMLRMFWLFCVHIIILFGLVQYKNSKSEGGCPSPSYAQRGAAKIMWFLGLVC